MIDLSTVTALFEQSGHRWSFKDGSRRIPTESDIETVIDESIEALKTADDLSQLETGRLIIQKQGGIYDVYVHVGSFWR